MRYVRFTHDVDLVIQLAPGNIAPAFAAFASLGYRPMVPVTAEQFADPAQRQQWITNKHMMVLNFQSDQHRETPAKKTDARAPVFSCARPHYCCCSLLSRTTFVYFAISDLM